MSVERMISYDETVIATSAVRMTLVNHVTWFPLSLGLRLPVEYLSLVAICTAVETIFGIYL